MTIVLHLPAGTDLATLAPDFTLSSGTCDQTSGAPPSPTFAAQNPATYTVTDGTTVNIYAVTVTLPVPISYGPTGTGTLAFDTPPETSQWTTASIAGGGGDIGNLTAMDSAVNALAASGITAPLAEIVGNPTATMPLGKWNSTNKRLTTLPGSNKATCIMATLRNDSGADLNEFDLSFTLTGSGADAELPGYVLYYSLTGDAGSWQRIGEYGTLGPVTASNIPLASPWANGATLYVLWVDDNANGVGDNWYGFDDVVFTPSAPGANILTFDFGAYGPATIDQNTAQITITVPNGTDVTALSPTYTLSEGASCLPASGSEQDFSAPVEYIASSAVPVITKTYTVTVIVRTPPSNDNFADAIELAGCQRHPGRHRQSFCHPRSGRTHFTGASNTVWFIWTAPADGNLTVNTGGSTNPNGWSMGFGYRHLFRGFVLTALTALRPTPRDTVLAETVTVPVTAGTIYHIQLVAGRIIFHDVAANIVLTWSFGSGGT